MSPRIVLTRNRVRNAKQRAIWPSHWEPRYPWQARKSQKPTVKYRTKLGGTPYHIMSDGSYRRVDAERHERKFFGMSARQFRKAKREARKETRK